ncbi:PBSX family phage terminase large subunit [Clostridium sp. D33t1_170424_F3]|uniref:PBSX family phage terminase large subunit n=1 Tax=Clostridium sp. D33t1_170424_F3 TaxID=2787099 RepID=UPI001A9BAFD2|nr:PBSX family phage terminase large subunit [Clostridium sp. D33t1_170424_F3]
MTKKQTEYLQRCNHRWNVKTGATGSGKSFVDFTVTIPKRLLAAKGEGLLVLLGNTKGTLERNILDPMREIWSPDLVGNISSDNTVRLFGKKVYALGADNKKHMARIQGATFEYVYGDEVTTWSEEVFQMLKSRLRCEHSHFDGTCNPDNPGHWFKKFLDSDADIYQQSYHIDDGALPAEVVAELKKEYAGTVYYDRFIEGRWTLAQGRIYDMFDKSKHVVAAPPGPCTQYYISMDYGTQNPAAMLLWGKCGGVWYMLKEYYYSGRESKAQKTDEQYYAELVKLAGDLPIRAVIVDPSAASMIACIRQHGRFMVRPADNAVLDGIRVTATALSSGKIKICESCENTLQEIQGYVWDDKAAQHGEDKPLKVNDHAMDAMRYFCMEVFKGQGKAHIVRNDYLRR